MRLINADTIFDNVCNHKCDDCSFAEVAEMPESYDWYVKGCNLKKHIDRMPTAYDVDKVVDKITSRKKEYLQSYLIHNNEELYGVACGLGDAIKIVKEGGNK